MAVCIVVLSVSCTQRELTFENVWDDSPTPQMILDFLQELDETNLRRFLRLCTSLACLPLEGLHRKISVKKVNGNVGRGFI